MKFPITNTRSIVILGYCLLVALALIGIATIYMELINSHRQSTEDSLLKKELINLSNTLTTMYQAEGTVSLLAFTDNGEALKQEYDSLSNRVFEQIDSLKHTSTDAVINNSIDSLSVLLSKKRDYALQMFQLMSQMDKDIIKKVTTRTIINGADLNTLDSLLAQITQEKDDTVHVVAEKKSVLRRLQDVFKSNVQDTVTHISKGSFSETKKLAVPMISDTIIDFIRDINVKAQNRNTKIFRELVSRQHELYIIKELTGLQINKIMDTMKEREYQANVELLKGKNESLKRSFSMVTLIGLSALIVAIFFMSWTVHSLNKTQRLQKNIEEAKKHAEKLLTSREQLIYTITHDIKAPLSSIIGFLDLLSEDTFSQKQQYYLNNMHSSASHILDLVYNLLNFHSIEKEEPQLTNTAFFPNSLLHSIYVSFLPLAQNKKLTFELHSSTDGTQTFLSDSYYIRQIVNNLLSNAIKYTQEKGKVVVSDSLEEKNLWKISVQDNGPGIALDDQAKIFEEFVRLDKQKKEVEGTGLGLTISKELATLLGGTIEVESIKGEGSTFTLIVPLSPATDELVSRQDKTPDVSSGGILFVDDDRVQLNLLSELMKKEDFPCICCLSAKEALSFLHEKPVDIIFTDINIPDMDGFELVKQIRKMDFPQAATIPVIAFSGGYKKQESELKDAGFASSLSKPFKAQQLLDIIEKYTSFKRKTDETITEKEENRWQNVMDFVVNDYEAAGKIIDSFIEETSKDRKSLETAFQKKDNEAIRNISHKMLTLMRMISARKIVSILTDFEKGEILEEKKNTLFHLLDEIIKDAEKTLKNMDTEVVID